MALQWELGKWLLVKGLNLLSGLGRKYFEKPAITDSWFMLKSSLTFKINFVIRLFPLRKEKEKKGRPCQPVAMGLAAGAERRRVPCLGL